MPEIDKLRHGCIFSVNQPNLWLHHKHNAPGLYVLKEGVKGAAIFTKPIAEKTILHHKGSPLDFMSILSIRFHLKNGNIK